ncbi:MAG TPA: hypothetical protein VFM60_00615 [Salinimicrobium sp.]|nr:hypothetical protein [Salinimicrobium sp.]
MQKVRFVLILFFLTFSVSSLAQETFIIDGDTLQLQQEVKGPLNLFYSTEDLDLRFFVQKGDRLVELLEEEGKDEVPKYKLQLEELTSDTEIMVYDVKFALYSLKHFVNQYNALVQKDYRYNASTDNVMTRFGLFTGISNNSYTDNPSNVIAPVIGLEFEIHDPNLAPRHSAFLHLRQSFKQDQFDYTSTQLSLNYRFKLIRLKDMDFHVDVELVNLMYSRSERTVTNEAGEIEIKEENGFAFNAPLSFGVGSDIKITDNGYITVGYNDFFSIVLDNNGHFPMDFTIGYKYNL